MPADFHSPDSFKTALSIAEGDLNDPSVLEGKKLDVMLLLLGLMYQEVSRIMELEPDAPSMAPLHFVHSPYGIKELQQIETLINNINI